MFFIAIIFCMIDGYQLLITEIKDYNNRSTIVITFCQSNPIVQVLTKLRNGKHPYIEVEYVSEFSKQVSIMNESQERIQRWYRRNIVLVGGK